VTFVRPLSVDDPAIGGKARSLARLAALGVPTPAAFAIDAALSRVLLAGGPALPERLRSPDDVAALEAARTTLVASPLPDAFQRDLAAALATLAPDTDRDVTFAVRSSAANEDSAADAAPGIFESCVRVGRDDVPGAVKTVLASALSPAAWSYALRQPTPSAELAVLVHPFVEATAHGAASGASARGEDVVVDAHLGTPTADATSDIRRAVAAASARFGASELEWAAQGDRVTFLQLRPFRAIQPGANAQARRSQEDHDDGWTWDAAHNPAPLSPAQSGLVALVDACCPTGLRQQVRGGYLFFSRTTTPAATTAPSSARVLFERLSADVDARLGALDDPPRLEAALELYLAAYTPLFAAVQPACTAARAALKRFLAQAFPDGSVNLSELTAGVASAATRRDERARAIARAQAPRARQSAIDAYLHDFGDESPRWDVAEPTFGEAPERLLFLGAAGAPPVAVAAAPLSAHVAAAVATRLAASQLESFHGLLASARDAVAVGEDDDHLFARLQAVVRRALLALGRRLVATGRLPTVDDVFFLPLPIARALDDPRMATAGAASLELLDLAALAAEGRHALATASAAPPALPHPRAGGAGLIAGVPGAPGRVLGRAVHHPPSAPLHADAILIAVTLLPTELPLLTPAALVVETGTALGHVAAQARERGIPAIVAARGARGAIREGQRILVDGSRGQITLIDEEP